MAHAVTLTVTVAFDGEVNTLVRKELGRNYHNIVWSSLVPALSKYKAGATIPPIAEMRVATPSWQQEVKND